MGYKEKCFKETDESMIKNMIDPKHNPLFKGVTYEKLKKNGWVKGDVDNPRRNYLKKVGLLKIKKYRSTRRYKKDWIRSLSILHRRVQKSEIKKKYPIQILSPATHQFIGNSFVPVERLRNMASRPTIEISTDDAKKEKLKMEIFVEYLTM